MIPCVLLGALVAALHVPSVEEPASTPAPEADPPNVIVLFADDMRADTVAAWGNPQIRTPHIDSLVQEGTSFRRTYCMGSPHGAVCVPSRAMLMTGRAYHQLDLGDMQGCVTLGEALRGGGYTSFATGKWHNGRGAFARTFDAGANVMFSGMSDHRLVPVVDFAGGQFSEKRTGEKHSSELFADSAVEFLEQQTGEQPFFCYVAFTAPHDPRDAPQPWAHPYYLDLPPLPPNFLPQHPWDIGMMAVRDEKLAAWPRTPEVVRQQLAEYYALIEHMDHEIGRILGALEQQGLADDTLVVFAADHGLAVGSHGLLGKQSVFEHSLRAPLVLKGPGVSAGVSNTGLTYLNDLYPTILSMCGVAGDGVDADGAPMIGRDLGPVLRGEVDRVRNTVFLSMGKTQRCVTDGRWKLIRYPVIDRTRLFDLAADPHETADLFGRPEHAQRVAGLTSLLEAWQRRTGDQDPLEVDDPKPAEIDLTGRERQPDRWQPRWIREKYFAKD